MCWAVGSLIFCREMTQFWRCNITLLLLNNDIRSKFNIFLYMYFVATLSWAAISGYFSKSASPLQGNIVYATPPLNLVRSLVLSLSGSFFGSQPRLQIHCIGPANTLHRACKYIAQGLQIHCKGHRLHRDSTFCAHSDSMPS